MSDSIMLRIIIELDTAFGIFMLYIYTTEMMLNNAKTCH